MGLFQWLAPGAARVNRLCLAADATTLSDNYDDAAHCLTDATDAKGNSVTCTLDAMGTMVGEQVRDQCLSEIERPEQVGQGGECFQPSFWSRRRTAIHLTASSGWAGSCVLALAALILVLAAAPAKADVYRYFYSPTPGVSTNPSLCSDRAEPWYSSASAACQGLKTVLPACDRYTATYRNYVATFTAPASCSVSWEYQNTGSTTWNNYSGTYSGLTVSSCPSNARLTGTSCTCEAGFVVDPQNPSSCVPLVNSVVPNKPQARDFCFANPIYPLTGVKKEYLDTGVVLGGLSLSLIYDTTLKVPANQADTSSAMVDPNSFGALWKSSFHHKLVVSFGSVSALLSRGDGKVLAFTGNGAGIFTSDASHKHKLFSIAGGYRFTDVTTGAQETFDSTGTLLSLTQGNGMGLNFSYAGPNLVRVQSSDGRIAQFKYIDKLISQITDANGRTIALGYDSHRNLVSLTWQDGKVHQFLYENTAFPWALTGKMDESNSRFATFTYDAQGRASTSEHAGGVERYNVSYSQPPQLVVTDTFDASTRILHRQHGWQLPSGTTLELPNGQSSSVEAASIMGSPSITSQSQPAGSGCAAATSAIAYDGNGNIASKDDFSGQRSCFAYDMSRNLATVQVEGLANTASCAVVLVPNAGLPAGSRKLGTQWHPDWSLVTKAAQPLTMAANVYNGQPDPFNGNAIASCAPTTAKLPDGKPVAVLCKQIVQATTDADGALGLASAVDTSVPSRVSNFTYDAFGRTLTGTDPLNRVTTYSYYGTSTDFTGNPPNFDAFFESVGLLLHMDGTNNSTGFIDSGAIPQTVTANGTAKISTTQSLFGDSSAYFDGTTNGYLSVAYNAAFSPGAGDYTVELYVRPTGPLTGQDRDLLGQSIPAGGDVPFTIRHDRTGVWSLWFHNGAAYQTITAGPVSLNQWVHLAMVKSGNTINFYVGGVNNGSLTIANGGLLYPSLLPMSIGRLGSYNGNYFIGYVDDVRFTKGVARYTANFTPPTQAFPNTGAVLDPNAVGHRAGDLQTVTNAAGHTTQFTLYDGEGRVKQMVDPKGVVTDTVFTPRGWVNSVTVTPPGGTARTTSYTYDNAGQLTGVAMPDATTMSYSYDAAHRLTGVTDAKGNSVTYALDGMGNKVGEQVKDPSGNLQRNITRVYDALNRVQQVTGASD